MTVDIISVYWSFQGGQWGEIYQTYSENINLDFARLNMDVVSMDSRKTYGQPSLDGELPGDPNADLRHPSFLNWTYKGGLFAGNLDPTNDLSGQSRIQAYVTGTWPTSTYKAGCITIYPMEKAPLQNSLSMTLGFRAPAANDPNLNDTIGQMFWDHKWDLGNITPNDVSHPKDVMISDGNRNNYLNVPFLFGSGDAWPRVAMVNISPASGPSWQYFCSKWYGQMNVQVGFPRYDAHPRIWRLGQIPVGG